MAESIYTSGKHSKESDPDQPKIYLSGQFHTNAEIETDWLKQTGCRHRCFSFMFVCPEAYFFNKRMKEALDVHLQHKTGLLMDSSAFTFFGLARKNPAGLDIPKLRQETIELYVDYVKANSKKWDFYVNFDYEKNAETVYTIQKQLESQGIRPVPVYHGDRDVSYLERYCKEGYKLIGISMAVKRPSWKGWCYYFDQVFNVAAKYGTKLHGFAVTSLTHMFRYPWYSVDSSSWAKISAFGKIIYADMVRGVMGQVHVSDRQSFHPASYNRLPLSVKKSLREQVEHHGFDFDKVRTDMQVRCAYNAVWFTRFVGQLKSAVRESRVEWESLI